MNALVNFNSQLTMSSREIAELTGKQHKDVLSDCRKMFDALNLRSADFSADYKDAMNRTQSEYLLNQDLTMTLVMGYSTELRYKVAVRWRELENGSKPVIPQTYAAALLEAGRLALENEKKDEQLRIAAPKVQFVDNFTQRESLQNASQVGQTLGISAIRLNRALDEVGGVYNQSVKRGRVFCQAWIDGGYGKMIQNEIGYPQAMFTTTGVYRVTEILTSEGVTL